MEERIKLTKKMKKVELVDLVLEYEDEIAKLENRIDNIQLSENVVETNTIKYLKKRIRCVCDLHRLDMYERELHRLLIN